jgi:hypothetical protein
MPKQSIIDKMNTLLFDPMPAETPPHERAMLIRYRDAFTYWLDNPLNSDANIRDYLITNHKIEKSQAYRDIANIKLLLGNVRNAGKEWHRHRVNVLLEKAAAAAIEGRTAEATALSKVATAFIKNNKLDLEDGEQLPFDEIIPPAFEPTSDPAAIGLKPLPNLRRRIAELKEKYIGEIEIQDIDHEEINEKPSIYGLTD